MKVETEKSSYNKEMTFPRYLLILKNMKKGLLLGAGFSYDLGMPLVAELTPVFLGMFNEPDIRKLSDHMLRQDAFGPNRPINKKAIDTGLQLMLLARKNNEQNYERLLAKLQRMEGIENPTQSDRDSYHYLFSLLYSIIHNILCLYQIASYEILYPDNKEWFAEFENLLSEDETWIFSLNHDLNVECLALDLGIPITYGDTGSITFPVSNLEIKEQIEFGTHEPSQVLTQNTFFCGTKGINIVKLHGGISELHYKDRALCCNLKLVNSSKELMDDFLRTRRMGYYDKNGVRIPSSESAKIITNGAGELDILSSSLLTGESKFSKTSDSKPGEEKLQLFEKVLQNLDELTIIGYSFGDKHINFRASNALLLNPKLHMRIVNPAWAGPPECLEQFDYEDRVRGAYCGAAPWIYYCKHQKWNVAQIEALKKSNRQKVKCRVLELMTQP